MQKTQFRWFIIFLLFTLNVISYIDRSAMAYAVPDIMHTLSLNTFQMGIILGVFALGYFVTNLAGGIAIDKWGVRKIILISALVWACSIGLTGLINGFTLAIIARFGLGLGEGSTFPGVARAISCWLPLHSRAKAFSNALVGVPLSLAIGAPICTALIKYVGWRWMFFTLAIVLLFWCPFFWYFFRNAPKQSRFVNKRELAHIEGDSKKYKKLKYFWPYLLKNKTLLSNNWAFFTFGYSLFFFMNWLPTYLGKHYHMNLTQVGLFSILPWTLAAIFLWSGGYLSDYILRKTNSLRYARSYLIMAGQILTLACLIPIVLSHSITIKLIAVSLAVAFNLSNNTVFYSVNIDEAKNRAGSALGIMVAGSAIAGFIAPSITGYIVQTTDSFTWAFVLMIALTVSSIVGVFFFHRR